MILIPNPIAWNGQTHLIISITLPKSLNISSEQCHGIVFNSSSSGLCQANCHRSTGLNFTWMFRFLFRLSGCTNFARDLEIEVDLEKLSHPPIECRPWSAIGRPLRNEIRCLDEFQWLLASHSFLVRFHNFGQISWVMMMMMVVTHILGDVSHEGPPLGGILSKYSISFAIFAAVMALFIGKAISAVINETENRPCSFWWKHHHAYIHVIEFFVLLLWVNEPRPTVVNNDGTCCCMCDANLGDDVILSSMCLICFVMSRYHWPCSKN